MHILLIHIEMVKYITFGTYFLKSSMIHKRLTDYWILICPYYIKKIILVIDYSFLTLFPPP